MNAGSRDPVEKALAELPASQRPSPSRAGADDSHQAVGCGTLVVGAALAIVALSSRPILAPAGQETMDAAAIWVLLASLAGIAFAIRRDGRNRVVWPGLALIAVCGLWLVFVALGAEALNNPDPGAAFLLPAFGTLLLLLGPLLVGFLGARAAVRSFDRAASGVAKPLPELVSATKAWQVPALLRVYGRNPTGWSEMHEDMEQLEAHGYQRVALAERGDARRVNWGLNVAIAGAFAAAGTLGFEGSNLPQFWALFQRGAGKVDDHHRLERRYPRADLRDEMRQLRSLQDQRDAGTITPEEYRRCADLVLDGTLPSERGGPPE